MKCKGCGQSFEVKPVAVVTGAVRLVRDLDEYRGLERSGEVAEYQPKYCPECGAQQ